MADWITEGTAHRSAVQIQPVIHLLVNGVDVEWRMWCSAGKGCKDTPLHVPGRKLRLCSTCRKLAQEAVDEGMLAADDLTNWRLTPGPEAED